MDKGYLLLRNPVLYQGILQILIYRKVLVCSRRTNIGENQLTAYLSILVVRLILIPYVFRHFVKLSIRIIRCILINLASVPSSLAS